MAYNDNVSYDYDWGSRMEWLLELMAKFPDKPMRKLQKEAMHMYPIKWFEVQRYWLSSKLMFKAVDIFYEREERARQELLQSSDGSC